MELAVLVHELERVAGVAVHVVVADGRTAVREEDHDLVDRLRVLREVVLNDPNSFSKPGICAKFEMETYPEHVSILQMRLGVTLLSVDEVRELGRVADEEHGRVVEHPVEVALLSLDFDSEACPFALNSRSETVKMLETHHEDHAQSPRNRTRHQQSRNGWSGATSCRRC